MTHIFKVGDDGFTRSGLRYRIVALLLGTEYPILAVISDQWGKEDVSQCTPDGRSSKDPRVVHNWDLLPPTPPKQTFREWCLWTYPALKFDDRAPENRIAMIADYLDEQARKE